MHVPTYAELTELARRLGERLPAAELSCATAESCTGGLVGHLITEIAGSSAYFAGGAIVYSNAAKHAVLGVDTTTLDAEGAVSYAVAAQMAAGERPEPLPETGPRELADLAHHFNRMARKVQELADARTTLFAGVSHDLRTPLARMRLTIEMLSIKPSPTHLAQLERDVDEMNALIGQMLEVARGLSTEAPADLDLCAWLKARARAHEGPAQAAASRIDVHCDDTLRVHAPPGMLGRVVDNLVTNALRYAPGVVELRAESVRGAADGRVRIGVLDCGPGISQAQLPTALRPFHRGAAGSGAPGGFGLGLATVQQLALANGWQVSLSARDGGGLAAWVTVSASR